MAKKSEAEGVLTPAPKPSLKKAHSGSQSTKNQKSILGFFQKNPRANSSPSTVQDTSLSASSASVINRKTVVRSKHAVNHGSSSSLTPAPSSDAIVPSSPPFKDVEMVDCKMDGQNGLPSPITPAAEHRSRPLESNGFQSTLGYSSPSRRAKQKVVTYAESGDENEDDDEDAFDPARPIRGRAIKKRITATEDDSGDDFGLDKTLDGGEDDDDLDNFIVPDDSEEEASLSKKRKRPSKTKSRSTSSSVALPPLDDEGMENKLEARASTAQQWNYDPENTQVPHREQVPATIKKKASLPASKLKAKAHVSEPEQRYPWLAKLLDIDRNPPDHPEYDPRTVYIPPLAWNKFSPFEKQYWEIKQKFFDTIVFFKKGKFYELYEHDATIGHQLFDLKLTDRVNMRMVGVPEMSLDHWANQFVAKGFKIARVDQSESALGKEMRERGDSSTKKGKEDKVIRRELACVLTAGTLVDARMLQDDMSTYCVSIKEAEVDNLPVFGISFVDTATGQFFVTEFVDDIDYTKFETFVAQTRPQEILVEKSVISVRALRILKNNTGPTTVWNYLKSGREFWTADVTLRELDAGNYFVSMDQENIDVWPKVLREARDNVYLMSSFGALVQYLRSLKIERDLITLGNFTWYDPIRKATSLVLDGQTLINLEIFANSFDGGSAGTLFTLLNRCITPFGKRMFRQWVCHPLADTVMINNRLDAVDSLNADATIRNQFTAQLTKLPDLERIISRIHAGSCRALDFVRVLEGFEQIEYTMSLLSAMGSGDGVIGQLISAMPDLNEPLDYWKSAFDRSKAKDTGILVPERGVEEDFDESQDAVEQVLADLDKLLKKYRRDLGTNTIEYRDNGKEIYQLEVPTKVKSVPKNWDQMSATQKVKRYYSPELRGLVRQLQEAQETHTQIVKRVAGRFYARFDQDYQTWLAAVRIISQLDCLISLAKASYSLGEPSCRPQFVESERSVVDFEELRHPCMLPNVTDFIPNDVQLGGNRPNINLLTGANAAGKSTILRMTCIAVIMAQIGCYVPCRSAKLTPVDRIMSRLGANDNIFAAQSTFFVELSETKKILSEATPRSLVILDELGRGTSSYDGVAVAQAVLHHIATHIGCTGFFATHYHSLAAEFSAHPEISPQRMQISVDEANRRVTFLYKLEEGVAEGSFGMHCAAMCGIPGKVIERAEMAAKEWEHTSRLKESLEKAKVGSYVPLGWLSDISWCLKEGGEKEAEKGLDVLMKAIESL